MNKFDDEEFRRDPQSLNRYLYTQNNPVMLVDPSGYWVIQIGLNIFGGKILGGNLDFMLAIDNNLNIALINANSAGSSISPSAATSGFWNIGIQGSYSNALTIYDLIGKGTNIGGAIAISKLALGYDTSISTETGSITHNISLGIGGGIDSLPASFETHAFFGEVNIIDDRNLKDEFNSLGQWLMNLFQ